MTCQVVVLCFWVELSSNFSGVILVKKANMSTFFEEVKLTHSNWYRKKSNLKH